MSHETNRNVDQYREYCDWEIEWIQHANDKNNQFFKFHGMAIIQDLFVKLFLHLI